MFVSFTKISVLRLSNPNSFGNFSNSSRRKKKTIFKTKQFANWNSLHFHHHSVDFLFVLSTFQSITFKSSHTLILFRFRKPRHQIFSCFQLNERKKAVVSLICLLHKIAWILFAVDSLFSPYFNFVSFFFVCKTIFKS